jgi:Xaa-Pro aminopeptidase
VNVDEVVEAHAEMTGINPKAIRSQDEVAGMREAQAQQAQAQQTMNALEQASKTAKNLAQSPTGPDDGDNALTKLMAARGNQNVMQGVPDAIPAGSPAPMAP